MSAKDINIKKTHTIYLMILPIQKNLIQIILE